jgi:hypothetical protein
MTWSLRIRVWWMFLMSHLYRLEAATWRGVWIWVGHLGISFRRIPRFDSKLMIKRGERRGIRVSQFGPLVMTWSETR